MTLPDPNSLLCQIQPWQLGIPPRWAVPPFPQERWVTQYSTPTGVQSLTFLFKQWVVRLQDAVSDVVVPGDEQGGERLFLQPIQPALFLDAAVPNTPKFPVIITQSFLVSPTCS